MTSRALLRAVGSLAFVAFVAGCGSDPSSSSGGASSGSSGGASSGGASSGSSGSSGASSGSGGTTAEEICVATINDYRKAKGLAAYTRWTDNEACTAKQAASDGASGKAHGAFGQCGESAQNECPGWPGPPETMIPMCLAMMMGEGPGGGHYDAIMSAKYTKVSCGFAAAGSGAIWAVQNFH
jgi:hypothetical protein